jgi:plasmid stabilization system protein ParE
VLPPVASYPWPSKPRVAGSSPAGRASSQSIRELATPASPQARRGSRSSPRAGTSPAGRASRLRPFTIQGTRGAASSLPNSSWPRRSVGSRELIQSLDHEVDPDAEGPGRRRFGRDSNASMRGPPRRFPGLRRVVASTRQPAVVRQLEYLREALEEAEAAARWYAERSPTAAAAFSDELDRAESAIARLPECLASLCPQHTPLFAAPLSVQRRLSRRTTTHSDRRCSACAAPARVLEAATAGASLGRCAPSAGSWRQGAEARRAKEACRARHVLAELR